MMMQPFAPGPLVQPVPATDSPAFALDSVWQDAHPCLINPGLPWFIAWHPRTGDLAGVPGWQTVGSFN